MKRLHRVFAFLIVPFLGYLLGATIFNFFWDKAEPGDLKNADMIVVAQSCERKGPVAWRGFGYYYKCEVQRRFADGYTNTTTVTGWLDPSDMGKEYAANTPRRSQPAPEERPYDWAAGLSLFVFGIPYLFVIAKVAVPAMPDRYQIPEKQDPPVT